MNFIVINRKLSKVGIGIILFRCCVPWAEIWMLKTYLIGIMREISRYYDEMS